MNNYVSSARQIARLWCGVIVLVGSVGILAQTEEDLAATGPDITAVEAVEQLKAEIIAVEEMDSGFAPHVGELSYDLGLQLASMGRDADALTAFQRADQNMKIHDGLYSENREILLRKVYEQQLALRDWDEAESALEQIAWVRARNTDTDSADYVDVLQELVQWNLARDLYGLDENELSAASLLVAHRYMEKIVAIYAAKDLPLDRRSLELAVAVNHRFYSKIRFVDVSQQRLSNFYLQRQFSHDYRAANDACQNYYRDNPDLAKECGDESDRYIRSKLPPTVMVDPYSAYDPTGMVFSRSYFRGKDLLLTQLEVLNASEEHELITRSILALADWYLLFDYQSNAEEVYGLAWQYAIEHQLLDSVQMDRPVPISTAAEIDLLPMLKTGDRKGTANLRIAVGATGIVDQIEITDTDIEDTAVLAEVAADVAMFRYRPMLIDGVPTPVSGIPISRQVTY